MRRTSSVSGGSLNDTVVAVGSAFLESQQVFFRSINEAVAFSQRYVEELHAARRANLHTTGPEESFEPKPHVSFLVDAVMETEKELVVADTTTSPRGTPATPSRQKKQVPGSGTAAREDAARRVVKLRKASLFDEGKELIGVVGIVRHAERTPKQKIKLNLPLTPDLERGLAALPTEGGKVLEGGYRNLSQLLQDETVRPAVVDRVAMDRCASIVEARPDGLEVKVKPSAKEGTASLVVKWGGTLSPGGVVQARQLGKELIARFFAAGDLPLDKMSLFTTNVEAYSPDEERLTQTASVMMQALTGNESFSDIRINDAMLSDLSSTTKTLIARAEQQFSAIMHVRSVSAAVHCLHIAGLRELLKLSIPPPLPNVCGASSASRSDGLFFPGSIFIERPMGEAARVADGSDEAGAKIITSADAQRKNIQPPFSAFGNGSAAAAAAGATTPYDVIRRVGELLRIVSAEVLDVSSTDKAAIYLHQHESLAEFLLRWRTHSRTYWRRPADGKVSSSPGPALTSDEFDLSNVNRLVDDAKYDTCHNIEHLHKAASSYFPQLHPVVASLRELDRLLTALASVATATLRGSNSSERFILGAHTCQQLFAKIEKDIQNIIKADMERSVFELLGEAQRIFIASKTNVNVEAVLAVQDKMLVSLRRRIGNNRQSPDTDEDSSPSTPYPNNAKSRSRFTAQQKDFDLFMLPEGSESNSDGGVCTHFYFAPQSHASTAQGCLFDCNSISGFTRLEGSAASATSSDVLHYMTHIIFKVFRCRRASLSDSECKDLLMALPLVRTRMMTEGEQAEALRQGLRDIYRQRYFTSVEVFMSTGAEDLCGGEASCSSLKPMIRVHPGIRPSQFTALNKEIEAMINTHPT